MKPVFVVANWLPIRKGELVCIRRSQVNFEERIIELQTGQTKNDESRNAPIPQGSDVESICTCHLIVAQR